MDRDRPRIDRDLRELLTYLRDNFRDAAARIDDYLLRHESPGRGRERDDRGADRGGGNWRDRDDRGADRGGNWRDRDDRGDRGNWRDQDQGGRGDEPRGGGGNSDVREPLERLREEVRTVSNEAADMEPAVLRLYIEAITAETRLLQGRAADPADQEVAARIMRALTAIVSEHRPGHVYGLARHHQTDWEEMARRARDELRGRGAALGQGGGNGGLDDEGRQD